jgi:hypothetical protein
MPVCKAVTQGVCPEMAINYVSVRFNYLTIVHQSLKLVRRQSAFTSPGSTPYPGLLHLPCDFASLVYSSCLGRLASHVFLDVNAIQVEPSGNSCSLGFSLCDIKFLLYC